MMDSGVSNNDDIRWHEMNEVNRGVTVLKPKKLFLDWVNSTEDEGVVLSLDEVSRDCTAYLTLEIEDDDELREFLEQNYDLLFEQELVGWIQDEAQWPVNRDFPTSLEWFDTEFHSLVLDLAEEELTVLHDA